MTGKRLVRSGDRKARFNELEQVVRHNLLEALKHFVEVGKALKEIRDDKLYKDFSYDSFDAYLDERWDLSRSYASRLINGAVTVARLTSMGVPAGAIANEHQARLLRPRLPEVDRRIVIDEQEPQTAVHEVIAEAKRHKKAVANGNTPAGAARPPQTANDQDDEEPTEEEAGESGSPDHQERVRRWLAAGVELVANDDDQLALLAYRQDAERVWDGLDRLLHHAPPAPMQMRARLRTARQSDRRFERPVGEFGVAAAGRMIVQVQRRRTGSGHP
jgi:hypothetical protein